MSASTILDGLETRRRAPAGGPTIVLLHGIGSNLGSFDRLSRALRADWGAIAVNTPGYGASEALAEPLPVARDYAERLTPLLKAQGPVLLLGHSLGTLIAAELAAEWPDLVSGLILVASAHGHGAAKGRIGAKAQARLDDLAALGPAAFARARAPRLLYRPESRPDLAAEAIAAMAAIEPAGYAQAVHLLATGTLAASLARTTCPSLVVVGARDVITPPGQSRTAHRALQDAAPGKLHLYAEIPDCGHLVHQEAPDAVAGHIAAFYADAVRPFDLRPPDPLKREPS